MLSPWFCLKSDLIFGRWSWSSAAGHTHNYALAHRAESMRACLHRKWVEQCLMEVSSTGQQSWPATCLLVTCPLLFCPLQFSMLALPQSTLIPATTFAHISHIHIPTILSKCPRIILVQYHKPLQIFCKMFGPSYETLIVLFASTSVAKCWLTLS